MIGTEAAYTDAGCPWPGGRCHVPFRRDEIVRIGKKGTWGDFVVRFVAELADGRVVFFRASDQAVDDQRWIRRMSQKISVPCPSRETGWAVTWQEGRADANQDPMD